MKKNFKIIIGDDVKLPLAMEIFRENITDQKLYIRIECDEKGEGLLHITTVKE